MTDYVGGFRYRLIHESLFQMISDSLDQLGWFDGQPGRENVRIVPEALPLQVEIPLNTIALVDLDMSDTDDEMGSNLSETRWTFYVDFYAADKSIGIHLINDVRDIMKGKMSSIGRISPSFGVYDYSLNPTLVPADLSSNLSLKIPFAVERPTVPKLSLFQCLASLSNLVSLTK